MLFRMHFYQLPLQIHVAVSSTSLIHVTCVGLHLLRSDHVVQKDIQSSVEMETTNWILVPCRLMPDSSPWPISCQRQIFELMVQVLTYHRLCCHNSKNRGGERDPQSRTGASQDDQVEKCNSAGCSLEHEFYDFPFSWECHHPN